MKVAALMLVFLNLEWRLWHSIELSTHYDSTAVLHLLTGDCVRNAPPSTFDQ